MSDTPPVPHPAEHDRRADYLELPAPDVAAARRFYERAFGWLFTDYGPDYTSWTDGRTTGGFTSERRVVRDGGAVVTPAYDFPGGRRFHFTDPAGNELAVWSDR